MLKLPFSIAIPEEKLQRVVAVVGIVLIAWLTAGIVTQAFANIFMPSEDSTQTIKQRLANNAGINLTWRDRLGRNEYDVIVRRNIFDSTNKIAKQKVDEKVNAVEAKQEVYDGPPVPTTLPIKLLGTIVSSIPSASVATIAENRGDAEPYRLGDKVLGKARITEIQRNKVFLLNNGRKEYVQTDEGKALAALTPSVASAPPPAAGGGVRETAPGKYVVDRGRIEQVMANMSQVMTQARVVPHFEGGKPAGWKIFAIKPESIYQELNLQNGDIIQRINGMEIDNPAKALEMYQQLASETNIAIDLVRRGTKQTFEYDIR